MNLLAKELTRCETLYQHLLNGGKLEAGDLAIITRSLAQASRLYSALQYLRSEFLEYPHDGKSAAKEVDLLIEEFE